VFSLIAFSNSSAAEVSLGVKGGLDLAKFYGVEKENGYDPYKNQVLKPGITVGTALEMKLAKMFAIQPELLFSSKGAKSKDGSNYYISTLNYLEIPVLLKFLIPAGIVTPQLFAGPSLAVKLGKVNGEYKNGGDVVKMTDEERKEGDKSIRKVDFGIALGGGIGIKAGPGNVIFDARYTLGLTKIVKLTDEMKEFGAEDDIIKHKNAALAFEVGYLFTF
jgi:hypothetical protein